MESPFTIMPQITEIFRTFIILLITILKNMVPHIILYILKKKKEKTTNERNLIRIKFSRNRLNCLDFYLVVQKKGYCQGYFKIHPWLWKRKKTGKRTNRCGVQTVPGLCFLKWKNPLVGVYSNAYAQAISRVGTVSTLQINSPCKPDNMFISAPFIPMLLWHVTMFSDRLFSNILIKIT